MGYFPTPQSKKKKKAAAPAPKPAARKPSAPAPKKTSSAPTSRQIDFAKRILAAGGQISHAGKTQEAAIQAATQEARRSGGSATAAVSSTQAPAPTSAPQSTESPFRSEVNVFGQPGTQPTPTAAAAPAPEKSAFEKFASEAEKVFANAPPPSEVALGGISVGGKVVSPVARMTARAIEEALARKGLAAEFTGYSSKAVSEAAKGILKEGPAVNTKLAALAGAALKKVAKHRYWIAGALAGYLFSTQLTYNIKDDASRGLLVAMQQADKAGDFEEVARLNDLQQELQATANDLETFAPIINFPLQALRNIKMNAEISAQQAERAGKPSVADVKFEEMRVEREQQRVEDEAYFARVKEEAALARQEQRTSDEAYFNKLAEERAAEKVQERLEEARYFADLDKQRRANRNAERRQEEEYFRQLREAADQRDEQKRLEAEEYWQSVLKSREKYWAEQAKKREENAPSNLVFGLFR